LNITGRCHCGNLSFILTIEPDPAQIPARACTCTFCAKHGGVWTSSPKGSLEMAIQNAELVNPYTFGTRTATFHVCQQCGVVPFVTSTIDGREYAVVSVNAFENVPEAMLNRTPISFDGEGTGDRLVRRARSWIPSVRRVVPPD
jgi:hypothetical protein